MGYDIYNESHYQYINSVDWDPCDFRVIVLIMLQVIINNVINAGLLTVGAVCSGPANRVMENP